MGDAIPVLGAKIRAQRPGGLRRARLDSILARLEDQRLGLVVAPAGSGKTTLLAQFVATCPWPAAWYRAETSDGDATTCLHGLCAALQAVLPGLAGGWATPEDACASLEAASASSLYLVIDDLHTLLGTPAEGMIERLVDCAPRNLRVLVATRVPPGFNLSALRVAGGLLELDGDDLRFRTWEVERLFAEVWKAPLPPDDLAELTQRTQGWAAALYLFHLGTQSQPPRERHLTLSQISGRSRLVAEYLARNVIDALPAEAAAFLLETCVLGRLTAALCDEFLGRSGSAAILERLAQRQILSHTWTGEETYRCHEVLRSHLELTLVGKIGEGAARAQFRRAAGVLERAGALPEALYAWARAEDREAMGRLLGQGGDEISRDPGAWLDLLPPAMRNHEPWLLLATARQHRAAGRWQAAYDVYRRAEEVFGDRSGSERCRRERLALAAWLEAAPRKATVPEAVVPGDWPALLLAAVRRGAPDAVEPTEILTTATGQLAAGVAALLEGRLADAGPFLERAALHPDASEVTRIAARIAAGIADLMTGDDRNGLQVSRAADDAERLGLLWLSRVSRAALALSDRPDGLSEAVGARLAFEGLGDIWGSGIAALFEGLGAIRQGQARVEALGAAADRFSERGAAGPAAWCLSVRALGMALGGEPAAVDIARRAEKAARTLGLAAPLAYAYRALAEATPAPTQRAQLNVLAAAAATEAHLRDDALPTAAAPQARRVARVRVAVRLFGGFRLEVAGQAVRLASAKPRARELLRLLAAHGGRPVHREVLLEALWPDAPPAKGTHNLQVAVSSLRSALDQELGGAGGPAGLILEREGDAYRLASGAAVTIDLSEFERALSTGRSLVASDDLAHACVAYERALEVYAGDLLPEDGPAEWAVAVRERCRFEASAAARVLAEALLALDRPAAAVRACQRGLQIDEYVDALWRLLVSAHERVPNPLGAAKARARYEEVVAGLQG